MRQKFFVNWAARRRSASRRIVLATLLAAVAIMALADAANPAGAGRAATDPVGFSITINLGSVARLSVLVGVPEPASRDAAPISFIGESGVSIRLTLGPRTRYGISYNTSEKDHQP